MDVVNNLKTNIRKRSTRFLRRNNDHDISVIMYGIGNI